MGRDIGILSYSSLLHQHEITPERGCGVGTTGLPDVNKWIQTKADLLKIGEEKLLPSLSQTISFINKVCNRY